MENETITYTELARRVGNIFLFNKAPELDPEFWYEGLENGNKDQPCHVHDPCNEDVREASEDACEFEEQEVYQWFLVSPMGADYLKRRTEELVFYSEVLDEYIWGVTHLGTSWDGVELTLVDKETV